MKLRQGFVSNSSSTSFIINPLYGSELKIRAVISLWENGEVEPSGSLLNAKEVCRHTHPLPPHVPHFSTQQLQGGDGRGVVSIRRRQ